MQSDNNFLNNIFFIEIFKFCTYIASNTYRVYLKFMSIQINYKNKGLKGPSGNPVLFVDENFNIRNIKKFISKNEFSYLFDLLKTSDLKKNFLFFEINSKKTIFLISIKKDLKTSDIESLGAKFHSYIDYDKSNNYVINSDSINSKINNFVGHFLHGLKLKSYEFSIYK